MYQANRSTIVLEGKAPSLAKVTIRSYDGMHSYYECSMCAGRAIYETQKQAVHFGAIHADMPVPEHRSLGD